MNRKNLFLLIVVITFITIIFIKSSYVNKIIVDITLIFIKSIFPSLFIMFVTSNILIKLGFPELISTIVSKTIGKNINKYSLFVFITSMFAGSPTNAKIINDLVNDKKITTSSAEKMLKYTSFVNPLFIVNTIGALVNDKNIAIIILISHILGNIVLFFIFRDKTIYKDNLEIKKENTLKTLFSSINSAVLTILNVYGVICFFAVISFVINTVLGIDNIYLSSFLEISNGVYLISKSSVALSFKCSMLAFFISFGGFSIHSQIINILEEKDIKYSKFFLAKLLHGFISSVISILILSIYRG